MVGHISAGFPVVVSASRHETLGHFCTTLKKQCWSSGSVEVNWRCVYGVGMVDAVLQEVGVDDFRVSWPEE